MTDLEEQALVRDLHQRPLPAEQPDIGLRSVALGRRMRRRRRAGAAGVALVAATVAMLTVPPALRATVSVFPAASAAPSSAAPSEIGGTPATRARYANPVDSVCEGEAAGDSVGPLDLTQAAIDRPDLPFVHLSWRGAAPRKGSVQMLFLATSADDERSRQFVVDIVDRRVVSQRVRDDQTGEVIVVDHKALSDGFDDKGVPEMVVNFMPTRGLSATFPKGSTRPLGNGWTWELSIAVDGAVTDSCKAGR